MATNYVEAIIEMIKKLWDKKKIKGFFMNNSSAMDIKNKLLYIVLLGAMCDLKADGSIQNIVGKVSVWGKEKVAQAQQKILEVGAKVDDGIVACTNYISALPIVAGRAETAEAKKTKVNRFDKRGNSQLYYAVVDHDIVEVELLLLQGADINQKNNQGFAPLHVAGWFKDVSMTEFLISKGADINIRGINGLTPLLFALSTEYYEIVELLVIKGADVNAQKDYGIAPLHIAAFKRGSLCIDFLMEHGADINSKNNEGLTPLHIAVLAENSDTAALLAYQGADVNVCDNDGKSPVWYAKALGNNDIIQLLRAYGAIAHEDIPVGTKNECKQVLEHFMNQMLG